MELHGPLVIWHAGCVSHITSSEVRAMNEQFNILVADRNPHVRDYLCRELGAEGYRVCLARDGREVIAMIDEAGGLDLLILDLDLPYMDGFEILKRLRDAEHPLPVMIHTSLTEYMNHPALEGVAGFFEKQGDTRPLTNGVVDALRKFYPSRFAAAQHSSP
jgi:CheY-like chemotaxis protein